MPEVLEFSTNFAIVVDLAVENKVESAVGSRHRLAGIFGQIDDCQSSVTEQDRGSPTCSQGVRSSPFFNDKLIKAFGVRSTMNHVIHGASDLLAKRFVVTRLYRTNDSTHSYGCLSRRSLASKMVHCWPSFGGDRIPKRAGLGGS